MGEALPIGATDRLPWLDTVESKTEAARPQPQAEQAQAAQGPGRGRKLVWLLLLALFCAGLFWVGRMSGRPKAVGLDQVGQVAEVQLPPAGINSGSKTAEPKVAAREPKTAEASPPVATATASPAAPVAQEAPTAVNNSEPKRAAKSVTTVKSRSKVRVKTPPKPAPPLAPPGQEIQVGAFSTEVHARQALSSMVERYPLLEAMPNGIAPIVVKPTGRRLYRLRLGANSKEQARLACQILRLDGRNCVVIG